MAWEPDDPLHTSASLGETPPGARNLPRFLCSLLTPGPVLFLGTCETALEAAVDHDVIVVDWDSRRLNRLKQLAWEREVSLDLLCRDVEREGLGVGPRRVANVVCLDVLERLRDDVALLEKAHRALAPDGRLVVRVRACPWVPSESARMPRPRRCYDAGTLREALREASFRTVSLRHWNFLGLPDAFLRCRVLHRGWRGAAREGEVDVSRSWWDRGVDLWFRTVENRVAFPTGVSLVAVAAPYLERVSIREEVLERGLRGGPAREAYEPLPTLRS
jgi:SAM-dependent methyltransferase